MTFVFPFLLGGLLLAGLPVLLHLLVRKKPRTLLFPAYRFLIQKRRSNTRNLWLKHLLLMLLRMALIALICLALARPRLVEDSFIISRERPVATVLIFDTTQSMEYKVGDQTRLDLAKRRALELLDQLPDDCRVLILDAVDPASFAREDWLQSLEKARQRIQSLTNRPESVPVTKALDEARRRFETWDDPIGQTMPHVICIFSDRTKASWDTSASANRKDELAPTQMLYFDVGIDEPVDHAILHADLGGRQSFLAGEAIPLNVVVKSTTKGDGTLIVQFGNQKIEQPVDFVPRQQKNVALEIDSHGLMPGLHQAEVRFETTTDALPHNNKRFLTFRILKKPNVLVLTEDANRKSAFAGALSVLHYDVTQKAPDYDGDLSKYDAVFLLGLSTPSTTLWESLETYVKKGGNVGILLPGDNLQRGNYTSDEAKKVMPASLLSKVEGAAREWSLADADWSHPFLATYRKWLADEVEYDFIKSPRSATKYWLVKPLNKKNVIVSYEGTTYEGTPHPAIVERPTSKGSGKVLLLTTPMDERGADWNNYNARLVSFYLALPMWFGRYLCAAPEGVTLNHRFGERPPSVKLSDQPFAKFELSSGEFTEEIRGDWVGDRLPRAGNYVVWGINPEKSEPIFKFSVNIPEEESDLTRVSMDEIESVLGKGAVVPQDRIRSIVDTLKWDEPVELFPWLMIALLFLLAIENLLANKFYQKSSEPEA